MPVKLDAHHVINLALVPVGRRPEIGNGIERTGFFRQFQFQSKVKGIRHRVQVIHDFESRLFAEIVDAGNVEQVIA